MTALETDRPALPDGVRVRRVTSDASRHRAAQRLVEHARPGDKDAGRLFLANTRAAGIDLTYFFASFSELDAGEASEAAGDGDGTGEHVKRRVTTRRGRGGRERRDGGEDGHPPARESLLIVLGSGRTALLFPSLPDSGERERELGAVVSEGLRHLDSPSASDSPGPTLAQALLLPTERASGRALEHAGFTRLAELAYLRKSSLRSGDVPEPYEAGCVAGVRVARVSELDASERSAVLCAALEASYEDTLDCPELQSMRATSDVLASHLATGVHDPSLWWVVYLDEVPLGVVLTSILENKTEAELVYMGLGRGLRGKGLGARLLGMAIATLRTRGIGTLSCAVDLRNGPALALYKGLGMRPFASRLAYVRDLRG